MLTIALLAGGTATGSKFLSIDPRSIGRRKPCSL
jgi:hypothetical protein